MYGLSGNSICQMRTPLCLGVGWKAGQAECALCLCAVCVQALFCLGDLAWGHAQLQEHLAGQLAAPAAAVPGRGQQQPIPYLQVRGLIGGVVLQVSLSAWHCVLGWQSCQGWMQSRRRLRK